MPSNFFGHLKRALELFISVRMIPHAKFYDHFVGTITSGKIKIKTNKQINTHPRSVFWQKIQNSTFL